MAGIKETWENTHSVIKRITVVVTLIASIAGAYTAVNTVFGVTIRPAWVWELHDLTVSQLETQMGIEQINRREYARELAHYRTMREQFVRDGQNVPNWLTNEISNTSDDLNKIATRISEIQRKIVELSK